MGKICFSEDELTKIFDDLSRRSFSEDGRISDFQTHSIYHILDALS
ncbi:MAG: hypothetical protein J7K29_01165 [Candidatus Cloacimonetes bacterium]|nr:hypothetical protein [Candidatus Cloacimonadota bacterium]